MYKIEQKPFDKIKNWDLLVKKSQTASFFQTKKWLLLWQKYFPAKTIVYIVLKNQEIIAIAPFSINKKEINFLGTTPVLGKELVTDFGDIVIKKGYEQKVWQLVFQKLQKDYPKFKLNLNFLRQDSKSFKSLKKLGLKLEKADNAPIIKLPLSWNDYLLGIRRKDRKELRRKIRRLENTGAFKICIKNINSEDVSKFIKLMAFSKKEKEDFLTGKMIAFFKDIIISLSKSHSSLCFLEQDQKKIAAAIVFKFKNRILLYNSGYEPYFSYLSPGLLLKAFLIKKAIEEKYKIFDFLRGDERYKFNLGAENRFLFKASQVL